MLDTPIERIIAIGFVIIIILFIVQLIIFAKQSSQFGKTETAIDTTSKNLNTTTANIDGMIAKANPVIDQVGSLVNKATPFLDWGFGYAENMVCNSSVVTPKPAFCNTPLVPLIVPPHHLTPAVHDSQTMQYY